LVTNSGNSAITTRFLKHATGLEVSAGPSGVAHSTRKSEARLKSVISTKVNISMQEHGGSRTVIRRFSGIAKSWGYLSSSSWTGAMLTTPM